jgi:hypothetical protein
MAEWYTFIVLWNHRVPRVLMTLWSGKVLYYVYCLCYAAIQAFEETHWSQWLYGTVLTGQTKLTNGYTLDFAFNKNRRRATKNISSIGIRRENKDLNIANQTRRETMICKILTEIQNSFNTLNINTRLHLHVVAMNPASKWLQM